MAFLPHCCLHGSPLHTCPALTATRDSGFKPHLSLQMFILGPQLTTPHAGNCPLEYPATVVASCSCEWAHVSKLKLCAGARGSNFLGLDGKLGLRGRLTVWQLGGGGRAHSTPQNTMLCCCCPSLPPLPFPLSRTYRTGNTCIDSCSAAECGSAYSVRRNPITGQGPLDLCPAAWTVAPVAEVFRDCSDIRITPGGPRPTPTPTRAPTSGELCVSCVGNKEGGRNPKQLIQHIPSMIIHPHSPLVPGLANYIVQAVPRPTLSSLVTLAILSPKPTALPPGRH